MDRHIVPFTKLASQEAPADLSFFDESMFPPSDDAYNVYAQDLRAGYATMKRRRVVITGLARDVGEVLPLTIARIERQGGMFADYRVVIYENDSQDETLELLMAWSRRNPRVHIVSEKRDDPVNQPTRCLSRAERMAYYRSQCQQTIRREFNSFDHVMIVDTDLTGGWSYDGMAHTFSRGGWDFVGANGIIYRRIGLKPNSYVQYDAWAFRLDDKFTPLDTKTVNYMLYHRGQPMQSVSSCFGGVGIYAMKPYLSGEYDGSDVEHVAFHRNLREKGYRQIYLNPNLLAVYGRKHRTLDRPMGRVIHWLDRLTGRRLQQWHYAADSRANDDRRAARAA